MFGCENCSFSGCFAGTGCAIFQSLFASVLQVFIGQDWRLGSVENVQKISGIGMNLFLFLCVCR